MSRLRLVASAEHLGRHQETRIVTVRDFPRDRTLALPAGKSYLAKTPG